MELPHLIFYDDLMMLSVLISYLAAAVIDLGKSKYLTQTGTDFVFGEMLCMAVEREKWFLSSQLAEGGMVHIPVARRKSLIRLITLTPKAISSCMRG